MTNAHNIRDILAAGPVIAVVTITQSAHALPLARALIAGGVRGIEITLRTPHGIDAIRAIAAELPDALVGAGTVLTRADLDKAAEAGARFAVSPGSTPALYAAGRNAAIPYLPAIATPSELMAALELGYDTFKLFPAAAVGGVEMLKALGAPFPATRFCPTGGVTVENAPRYLELPNVLCVGGSWLTPPSLVAAGDWSGIERLARAAAALKRK